MRSVRVVLPASMWAAIPMLRVMRRSILVSVVIRFCRRLPAVVGVGSVRLRHALDVLLLLHGAATALRGVEQLARDALDGGALRMRVRGGHQPAKAERLRPARTDLDGHLVGGAAHAPALDLGARAHVVERLTEHLERLLAAALLNEAARPIEDAAGEVLLALAHQLVHERRHRGVGVDQVRFELADLGASSATHADSPYFFGFLVPYLLRPWLRWT